LALIVETPSPRLDELIQEQALPALIIYTLGNPVRHVCSSAYPFAEIDKRAFPIFPRLVATAFPLRSSRCSRLFSGERRKERRQDVRIQRSDPESPQFVASERSRGEGNEERARKCASCNECNRNRRGDKFRATPIEDLTKPSL